MNEIFRRSLPQIRPVLFFAVCLVLASCERPRLQSAGAKETVEKSTPPKDPVNLFPQPRQVPERAEQRPSGAIPPTAQPGAPVTEPPSLSSPVDPIERAKEIARIQKMLDAQVVGIRSIESDFSRHSATLNQLRSQLQLAKARQAGAGSGGVRIERIAGESTIVDHEATTRDLEAKIEAEEPIVAQLSGAFQGARQQYADLKRKLDQFLVE